MYTALRYLGLGLNHFTRGFWKQTHLSQFTVEGVAETTVIQTRKVHSRSQRLFLWFCFIFSLPSYFLGLAKPQTSLGTEGILLVYLFLLESLEIIRKIPQRGQT